MDSNVRVFTRDGSGKSLTETGRVLDASASGARLDWVRHLKWVGQIAEIEYRGVRASFRVAWIGSAGSKHEGNVGLEALEPGKNIWGLPEAGPPSEVAVATLPAVEPPRPAITLAPSWSGAERRKAQRFTCSGGIEYWEIGADVRQTATVSDVSSGGCYVETRVPLAVETRVELRLRVNDLEVSATGEVRVSHPGMGMGLAFREMTSEHRQRLDALIASLGSKPRSAAPPPPNGDDAAGLFTFLLDLLKDRGVLTAEEYACAASRAQRVREWKH
jgi:hypothetical protein